MSELKRLAAFLNEDMNSLLPIRYSVVPKELAIDDEFRVLRL